MSNPLDKTLEPETGAETIWAKAADWLMDRRVSEDWRAVDQAALDAWLSESNQHLVAYWRLEAAWDRTHRLAALRIPASPDRTARIAKSFLAKIAGVVAVAAVFAGMGAFYLTRPAEKVFATATGGHRIVNLADGSSLELNTDTLLRISETASERSVTLDKGEAYFKIRHNAARLFTVVAGNRRVTDLGTAFVIRKNDENLKIVLLEGRAKVDSIGAAASSSSTMLMPGDVAIATANAIAVTKVSKPLLANDLAWRRGLLVFNNTPLATVVTELNRYNDTKLEIADSSIAKIGIGGTFPTNDMAAFVRVAHELMGLQAIRRGDRVIITR